MTGRNAGVMAALVVCIGCSAEQLGLPRTPVSATSPQGERVAFVRNHPNPDPPSQTIWLQQRGERAKQIRELAPDADWCNTIVWSADGSTVAYLVQDARLITIDAESQRIVSEIWLTSQDGYPTSQMVVELSLTANGREALFRTCDRNVNRPGYVHDPSRCGELLRTHIRPIDNKASGDQENPI